VSASASPLVGGRLHFDTNEFDPASGTLLRGGTAVRLRPKSADDRSVSPTAGPSELLVGRDEEIEILRCWWRAARNGTPTVAFLAAEAGVGKSTLVNAFLEELQRGDEVLIGRGQCVEQFGGREPYLPFLDALAGLCRVSEGAAVRDVLLSRAPLWMRELPGLLDEDDVRTLRLRTADASKDRMMRELGDALDALSACQPVVIVCEDVHAADRPSVDLLRYLAFRPQPARLLVICTYRPAEAIAESHPIRTVVSELRARRRCRHLCLELLSPTAVGTYLDRRLAPAPPAATREIRRGVTE
jgi:predicted ATPase